MLNKRADYGKSSKTNYIDVQQDIFIKNLSLSLLFEMEAKNLTVDEMARKCDISARKLCEIIYREKKGLRLSTILKIKNAGIDIFSLFNID